MTDLEIHEEELRSCQTSNNTAATEKVNRFNCFLIRFQITSKGIVVVVCFVNSLKWNYLSFPHQHNTPKYCVALKRSWPNTLDPKSLYSVAVMCYWINRSVKMKLIFNTRILNPFSDLWPEWATDHMNINSTLKNCWQINSK